MGGYTCIFEDRRWVWRAPGCAASTSVCATPSAARPLPDRHLSSACTAPMRVRSCGLPLEWCGRLDWKQIGGQKPRTVRADLARIAAQENALADDSGSGYQETGGDPRGLVDE